METSSHSGKFKVMSGRKFQYYMHEPAECYHQERFLKFAQTGLPLILAPTIMSSLLLMALAR